MSSKNDPGREQAIRDARRAAETYRPAPSMPRSTPDAIRKPSEAIYNTTRDALNSGKGKR